MYNRLDLIKEWKKSNIKKRTNILGVVEPFPYLFLTKKINKLFNLELFCLLT